MARKILSTNNVTRIVHVVYYRAGVYIGDMSIFKKLFGASEEKKGSGEKQEPVQSSSGAKFEKHSITILPRIRANYAHLIYASDAGKTFKENPLPPGVVLTELQQPITKPLYDDLLLCFAVDKGDSYELLQNEFLERNPSLTLDVLQEACTNALIKEIGDDSIKIKGDPTNLVMVTAGGNFEAALILLDDFWNQVHEIFEGNVIVAIPTRDVLVICKESNMEAQDKIKNLIISFFQKPETQGLLSKGIYLREVGKSGMRLIGRAF